MKFDVWTENIDPRQLLDRALSGMRAFFAGNRDRDLLRTDAAIAAGSLTPEDGAKEKARITAAAAETEQVMAANVAPRLEAWLTDPDVRRISPAAVCAIADAVDDARWEALFEAFFSDIKFGTGGIRGRAVMSVGDLRTMAAYGIDAAFLRGPNLFNDLTVLRLSSAVARYAADKGLHSVVIGFDSRIGGCRFAELIARLFLERGTRVNLFAQPCPFPQLSYAVVHTHSDLGIFISASHNDKRYNGYKLTSASGAQLTNTEREAIFRDYVAKARFADVPDLPPLEALSAKLNILGSEDSVVPGGATLSAIDPVYLGHLGGFIVDPELLNGTAPNLNIGYCAFYGAGSKLVPKLLRSSGFPNVTEVTHKRMNEPDGFFPCFEYTMQPDPGDPAAAKIAVEAFIAEHGHAAFDALDILIGTDPDADRMGLVVKVPANQRDIYGGDWTLLKADEVWALLLWYRLKKPVATAQGRALLEKAFLCQSHVTSDFILDIAAARGLAALRTWVGFSLLAEAVSLAWGRVDLNDPKALDEKYFGSLYSVDRYVPGRHTVNVGCFEESNGFSILGGPPPDANPNALGSGGHVRDKDGTLAGLLCAEIAAQAKAEGKTVIDLIDGISLEGGTGLYVNKYRPDPPVGQYEGVSAIMRKLFHIQRSEELRSQAVREGLVIGGMPVVSTEVCFGKGKYAADPDHGYKAHKTLGEAMEREHVVLPDPGDAEAVQQFVAGMVCRGMAKSTGSPEEQFAAARAYFFANVAVFPEEGMRFYFSADRKSHITLRPSGTSRNLKIYVQLCAHPKNREELLKSKREMLRHADETMADFAQLLGMKW
ncbi:MAG: hypothetical protein WC712_04970 [Candidatus Brocadiia bacterium]